MGAYILRKGVQALVVLLLVTFIVFALMRLLPGDPILVYVSQDEWSRITSQDEIDRLRHEYGTDRPIVVQYIDWLGGVVQGDLGDSIFLGTKVTEEIGRALPRTLYIGVVAWLVAHFIGLPAGVISAIRRGKWQDSVLTVGANIGITVPIFWLGILLIYFFGLHLRLLPIQGYTSPTEDLGESLRKIVLPVFCLALPHMAGAARQTRSAMLEVTQQDYVRTAWAKGLDERRVILRHTIRNGIIPVVTLGVMTIPRLIGGAVLVENVFNIPGMGRLATEALFSQDYAIVQGIVLIVAIIVVVSNLAVEVSYGWIDPRIRHT
ncbi:ABC transporter permease [Chloroflexota bacterium]